MIKNKPSVTVFVSAYNEENNIKNFLNSVLKQSEKNYNLDKIVVISDGSTDKTTNVVESLKSRKIKLIKCKKRIGKSSHLNYIYKNLKSEYLIQSDADVIFGTVDLIEIIVKTMEENPKIVMCGGNPTPLKSKTFIEKAINSTTKVYHQLRVIVRNSENPFSADGRLLAFRKKFIKNVKVPNDMIANDAFVYFICKTKNLTYKFIKKAVVYYRSPQTIRDQIKQNSRFRAAPIRFKKYFSAELINREYKIPRNLYLRLIIKEYIRNPLGCSFIYLINCYCKLRAFLKESKMNAKWEMALSSKKLSTK